jgi:hypothetical protein
MRHFANFAPVLPAWALPAAKGADIGILAGGVAGLAKGAGIGESEEERKNTTALGRIGKLAGNTLGGAAVGGVVGGGIGAGVNHLKNGSVKGGSTSPNPINKPATNANTRQVDPTKIDYLKNEKTRVDNANKRQAGTGGGISGYQGLDKEAASAKVADRAAKWREYGNNGSASVRAANIELADKATPSPEKFAWGQVKNTRLKSRALGDAVAGNYSYGYTQYFANFGTR